MFSEIAVGAPNQPPVCSTRCGRGITLTIFTYQFTPNAGPVATQIGAPAAPDLSGRSFRYPENTAQQRARRYRPNAASWTPLGWSEKNRKVAISGVLPRSGLGWLSSRDRGVLPTFFPTSLFGGRLAKVFFKLLNV